MISDQDLRRWLSPATVALTGDLIRGVLWAAVIVVWAIYPQIYARMWHLTISKPGGSDFTIFYYTARLVADGLPMYGASPARYGVHWTSEHLGNLNPPHFQLLLQPLAALSYEQAFVAWGVANALALVASLAIIARTLGLSVTWRRVAVCGALIMASTPFTAVAVTSEATFLLMVPFTLWWRAARRGEWTTAGAWLGLCVALKLFFLLFVPWLLWKRQWRALGAALAAVAACVVVGLLAYDVRSYRLWVGSLGTVGWWWLPMNASWQGLISRMFEGGATIRPVISAPSTVPPLSVAGALLVCAGSVWAAARLEHRAPGADAAILALLTGAILASPLGWVYYLPLVVAPVAGIVWDQWWRHVPPAWRVVSLVAAAALYVPLEQAAASQPSAVATLTCASSYFWGLAPSWVALVMTARSPAA